MAMLLVIGCGNKSEQSNDPIKINRPPLEILKIYDGNSNWSDLEQELINLGNLGAAPSMFIRFEENGVLYTINGSSYDDKRFYGTWNVGNKNITVNMNNASRVFEKIIITNRRGYSQNKNIYLLNRDVEIDLEKVLEYKDGRNGIYVNGQLSGWVLYWCR
jgi:hypothetical protein